MKNGTDIIAGVHADFDDVLSALKPEERAGWYYLNSTSNDLNSKLGNNLGTSKELRGLTKPNQKMNDDNDGYYFFQDSRIDKQVKANGTKDDLLEEVGHKGEAPWGSGEKYAAAVYNKIDAGPCLFYLNEENKLCCLFSPSKRAYTYSYVYYKPDDKTIKREKLQEAVGDFITGLNQKSPESSVAAVRFSTENFETSKDLNVGYLNMLGWTKDPQKEVAIMNLAQGGGTALTPTDDQYNYVLTGGTSIYTGLKAFEEKLLAKAPEEGDKYLIIFTDGIDDSLKNIDDKDKSVSEIEELIKNNGTADKTVQLAKKLKDDKWTIYCIMLPSDGQKMGGKAETFLRMLSSAKDESEKTSYVFDASDGLQLVFNEISREITYALSGYNVKDYIDPRFDLIAEVDGEQKLIRLNAGGSISIEGLPGSPVETKTEDISGEGKKIVVTASDEAQNATLCWDARDSEDGSNGMYYIQWKGQTIPGCSVGSSLLNVWSATITLRAKDDFIGGNAVLTNGENKLMNYVYSPKEVESSSGTDKAMVSSEEDLPSKGFPRVTVNVGLLPRDTESEQVIYLGEQVKPLEIAKSLMDELKRDDAGTEGSHYYWEYLERYAKKHESECGGLDGLLRKLIVGTESVGTIAAPSGRDAVAGTNVMAGMQDGETEEMDAVILDETIEDAGNEAVMLLSAAASTGTPLKIPYSYLTAVPEAGVGDTVTQTGGKVHEDDVLGTLTYTWEEAPGIQTEEGETAETDGAYVTKNTTTRKYILKVEYEPLPESSALAEAIDGEIDLVDTSGGALTNRDAGNDKLITEEAYHWRKKAVGNVIDKDSEGNTISSTGTHITKIVRGELALKVSAKKGFLDAWFSNPKHTELTVKVNATRVYAEDGSPSSPGAGGSTLEDSVIQPLTVTIKESDLENAIKEPNGTVSFYTYYTDPVASGGAASGDVGHHPYTENAPQMLPIGTYTLSLPTDSAESIPFKTLKYADEADYAGHFTVVEKGEEDSADPTDGAINVPDATDDKIDKEGNTIKQIGKNGSSKDVENENINFGNYIAPKTDEGDTPTTIGFYLGTEPVGAGAPSSTRTPNGPYLDNRLGMVEVDLETGSLTVKKKVTGDAGETNKDFHFEVTLYTDTGKAHVAEDISGTYGKMTFENGKTEFVLKNGQSLTAEYLPAGLFFEVKETNNTGYTTRGEVTPLEAELIGTITPTAIDSDEIVSGDPEDAPSSTDSTESTVVGEGENTTGDTVPGTPSVVGEGENTTGDTASGTPAVVSEGENTTGDTAPGTPSVIGADESTPNGADSGMPAAISADEGMPGSKSLIAPIAGGVGEPRATDHPASEDGKILSDSEPSGGVTVSFTNDREPATASLTVTKKLNVSKAAGGLKDNMTFNFVLTPNAGNPSDDPVKEKLKSDGEEAIKLSATITSGSAEEHGVLTGTTADFFEGLKFGQLGTYTYTLSEETGTIPGVKYDNTVYTVTVVVSEGADPNWGSLKATVSVAKKDAEEGEPDTGGSATFTNSYATGGLTVSKTVAGVDGETTRDFNFTVTLYKDSETVATEVNGTYGDGDAAMTFTDGVATFKLKHNGSKTATGLPAGLRYEVTEKEADTDGYGTVVTGDGRNGRGTIPANKTATVTFTNTKPAASIILGGKKDYYLGEKGISNPLTEGQFTFELKAVSAPEGIDAVPMPEGAATTQDETGTDIVTATTTNKPDGSFEFGGINYTQQGIYKYTITEKPNEPKEGESSDTIYDLTVYDVTVTVTPESGTGHLKAEAVYALAGSDGEASGEDPIEGAEFTNFTPVKEETSPGENEPVYQGQRISYEISWRNPGKEPAAVTVTDQLAVGVDYVSAGTREGSAATVKYDEASRTVTWNLGEQEGGAFGTVTLTVEVNEKAASTIENGATVKVDDQSAVTTKVVNPVYDEQTVVLHGKKTLMDGTQSQALTGGEFAFVLTPVSAVVEEQPAEPEAARIAALGEDSLEPVGQDAQTSQKDETEQDGQVPQTDAAGQDSQTLQTDAAGQDAQTSQKDEAEQDGQVPQTDTAGQDGQMSQTDEAEQDGQVPQTDAAGQDSQMPQTDAAGQDSQAPQSEPAEQSDQEPQTNAVEQSGQALQTETAAQMDGTEQSGPTPQMDAVVQGDLTTPLEAGAQDAPASQTAPSMMTRRAVTTDVPSFLGASPTSGEHSFLGTAPVSGSPGSLGVAPTNGERSFLGTAPVSGGRDFSGAASVSRRNVARSAPAMLSDDIIVETVDESSSESSAEFAQEPVPEIDVDLDEADVSVEESGSGQEPEAVPMPEAEWTDPAEGDAGDIILETTDDTPDDAEPGDVIVEEVSTDPGQGEVQEEEIIDISDDGFLDVPEGEAEIGSGDIVESESGSGDGTIEESETEGFTDPDQTVGLIELIEETEQTTAVMSVPGMDGISEISDPEMVELKPEDMPMPVGTTGGTAAVMNDASGIFAFGAIKYETPGTYRYTIQEQRGADEKIDYDTTVYDVTVTVERKEKEDEDEDAPETTLVASVEYKVRGEGGETKDRAEFTNRLKPADPPQSETDPQTESEPKETETEPAPEIGSLTVTKVNRDATTNETIVLVDAQFYVALFADSTLTQRVSDVQTLRFQGNSASASVTFGNLAVGTYYVSETNAAGTPASGGEYSGGAYYARYANGQQAVVTGAGGSTAFSFENVFSTLPDPQHYKNVKELTITKNVTDGSGAARQTNEVFYAGIFADAGYTQLAGHVSRNIVALEMGGNSSVSAAVQVIVPSEGETKLYVTEVDANGAPVANSGSFPYKASVVGGTLSLNINSGSQSVAITNTAIEETEEETETETEIAEEFESEAAGPGGVGSGATAAKTGDEAPIEKMLLLMAISLAMTLLIGSRSKRGKYSNR